MSTPDPKGVCPGQSHHCYLGSECQEPRRPSHSKSMSGTSQDTGLMCMKTEEYSRPRCSHYTPVGEVVSHPLAGHPRANCQTHEPINCKTLTTEDQLTASSLALSPGPSPRRRPVGPWLAPSDHWTVAQRYLEEGCFGRAQPLTPLCHQCGACR